MVMCTHNITLCLHSLLAPRLFSPSEAPEEQEWMASVKHTFTFSIVFGDEHESLCWIQNDNFLQTSQCSTVDLDADLSCCQRPTTDTSGFLLGECNSRQPQRSLQIDSSLKALEKFAMTQFVTAPKTNRICENQRSDHLKSIPCIDTAPSERQPKTVTKPKTDSIYYLRTF
jgi:hypothetical protein